MRNAITLMFAPWMLVSVNGITLEPSDSAATEPALRLGLRMIKGLSVDATGRIMQAQQQLQTQQPSQTEQRSFRNAQELARMASLNDQQLGFLARSGAFVPTGRASASSPLGYLLALRHHCHWNSLRPAAGTLCPANHGQRSRAAGYDHPACTFGDRRHV